MTKSCAEPAISEQDSDPGWMTNRMIGDAYFDGTITWENSGAELEWCMPFGDPGAESDCSCLDPASLQTHLHELPSGHTSGDERGTTRQLVRLHHLPCSVSLALDRWLRYCYWFPYLELKDPASAAGHRGERAGGATRTHRQCRDPLHLLRRPEIF